MQDTFSIRLYNGNYLSKKDSITFLEGVFILIWNAFLGNKLLWDIP